MVDLSTLEQFSRQVEAQRELPPPAARRALRLAGDASLEDIGRVCGVSREAVRLWELGLRNPSGPRLLAYVSALRVLRGGSP